MAYRGCRAFPKELSAASTGIPVCPSVELARQSGPRGEVHSGVLSHWAARRTGGVRLGIPPIGSKTS